MNPRSTRRDSQVGIDRLIRLSWLERTSQLVLAGNDAAAVKTLLQEDLSQAFRSKDSTVRGSLDKTITILMKTWVRPRSDLREFRDDGLKLVADLGRPQRVPIHWGMVMATYPFWGVVAACVGRLVRLQGAVCAREVQRRMRERYGERETVSRRVRYVLRSYVDWGVLRETERRGVYARGTPLTVHRPDLVLWLVEAVVRALSEGTMQFQLAVGSPGLFPFELARFPVVRMAAMSRRLDIDRHDLDQDLVTVREMVRQ